jgi:hypothetical protein
MRRPDRPDSRGVRHPTACAGRSRLLGPRTWQVLADDITRGAYRLETFTVEDLQRAAEIDAEYPSLDLGLVDASVIALCERLGETKVATLDRVTSPSFRRDAEPCTYCLRSTPAGTCGRASLCGRVCWATRTPSWLIGAPGKPSPVAQCDGLNVAVVAQPRFGRKLSPNQRLPSGAAAIATVTGALRARSLTANGLLGARIPAERAAGASGAPAAGPTSTGSTPLRSPSRHTRPTAPSGYPRRQGP